ncbi:MAG: hypothetical protein ACRDF7_05910 [Candidatus Limnocylindrales bacterium]
MLKRSIVAALVAILFAGACQTAIVPSPTAQSPSPLATPEFGPATWWLDPAFPPPEATSTLLHVLVDELACHSFTPATGRMSDPLTVYTPTTLTITIGVRPLGGWQTCPLPPGTPTEINLSMALLDRSLVDGGRVPPGPPVAP